MDPELHITDIPSGYIISKERNVVLLTIPECQRLVSKMTTDHPEYFRKGKS